MLGVLRGDLWGVGLSGKLEDVKLHKVPGGTTRISM